MVERIRDSLVAEEIAAQAGTEETPPLFLNELLTPVIFGPQRPPLAASGYFPGCLGVNVGAVALNTSHVGIFVSGTNVNAIIRVNSILIFNQSGGVLTYGIQRLDNVGGFSSSALVPGYISAGSLLTGGVFSIVRSNTVPISGVQMAQVRIEDNRMETIPGPWVINNGGLVVAPTTVNQPCRIYMNYEHWPSIRRQPIA